MDFTERNDKAFAEFMVRLAKKMIEREDGNIAFQEEQKAITANYVAQLANGKTLPWSGAASGALQIASLMQSGVVMQNQSYSSEWQDLVTEDELAVIRAYFNGDDVLVTIMSQER